MSQAKVDQYKKDKMNRKKNVQKDKVKRAFRRIAVGVVSLALVGWLGYSVVYKYEQKQNSGAVSADIDALNDYVSSLSTGE